MSENKSSAKQRISKIDPDKLEAQSAPAAPVQEEELPNLEDFIQVDPEDSPELNFIPISQEEEEESLDQDPPKRRNWALIIPALVLLLCLLAFVVASQAGWIQSFISLNGSQLRGNAQVTAFYESEEKETLAKLTTEEETTEEYIPSYYVIYVNLAYNVVTVYLRGEKLNDGADIKDPKDDEYDLTPVIAFTCSPGVGGATPTGQFFLQERNDWCLMEGDVYTQYATRIDGPVMFHSIPYYSKDPGDIETYEYNILGYEASSACVRLNTRDAFWIFVNCPMGTEVNIVYNWDSYRPLDPEPIYQIPTDIPELMGWDPTDTVYYHSDGNPWITYSAGLTNDTVYLPSYSSVSTLLSYLGPTDVYGNDLSEHFYTDGGYYLDTPGVYTTTGYIEVGNLKFSYPITIYVTEAIADEYYEDYGEIDSSDDEGGDDYNYDYGDDYSYDYSDDYGSGDDYSYEYSEEPYYEEPYYEDSYEDYEW